MVSRTHRNGPWTEFVWAELVMDDYSRVIAYVCPISDEIEYSTAAADDPRYPIAERRTSSNALTYKVYR